MLKKALVAMGLGLTMLVGCSIRTQVPQIASPYDAPGYFAQAGEPFAADPAYDRSGAPAAVAFLGATRGEAVDKGEGAALPPAKAKADGDIALEVPKTANDLPPVAAPPPAPVKRAPAPVGRVNPPTNSVEPSSDSTDSSSGH